MGMHKAHRLAWVMVHGPVLGPDDQIDHINGIRHDNRLCNLRVVSNRENCQNQRSAPSHNFSTKIIGTSFNKRLGRFESYIKHLGRKRHLGFWETAEEAHQAYITAKREIHPFGTI